MNYIQITFGLIGVLFTVFSVIELIFYGAWERAFIVAICFIFTLFLRSVKRTVDSAIKESVIEHRKNQKIDNI